MNAGSILLSSLIALGSPIAFAASEGGDTWSAGAAAQRQGAALSIRIASSGSIAGLLASDQVAQATSSMGTAISPAESDRIVELNPTMRSMNVAYGERVIFRMNGKSFAWRFDVMPSRTHVDLREIAPADFPMRELRVFVAPQPDYRGG
jgi:hypothetical protein